MRRFLSAVLALAASLWLTPTLARAQTGTPAITVSTCGTLGNTPVVGNYYSVSQDTTGKLCTAASVSASITGFRPTAYGTPISATGGGATGTLPAGAEVVAFNVGTFPAYCQLGASVTSSATYIAASGGWFGFAISGDTQLSCQGIGGTTTINMAGGSGLPTGTGGGGGSGGGGAVTIADGADVTLGAKADAATCATTNTAMACFRQLHADAIASIPAGTNTIGGTFPVAQTTGGVNTTSKQVANNTTSVALCASACTLYGVYVQNNSGTIAYLKLYNASQGSTTCGSGTPVDRILIPASTSGAGAVIPIAAPYGAVYGTALTSCVTTGYADADATAPAASAYQFTVYTK
jgi:hypothetical protein